MKKITFIVIFSIVLVITAAVIISRGSESTIEQCIDIVELEAKITKARERIQQRKMGHVIVGRGLYHFLFNNNELSQSRKSN